MDRLSNVIAGMRLAQSAPAHRLAQKKHGLMPGQKPKRDGWNVSRRHASIVVSQFELF